MVLSTHFITSSAVASFTDSPVILVAIAILIHFALDLIPHWQYVYEIPDLKNKIPELIIDILAGPLIVTSLVFLLWGLDLHQFFWFFLGGIAGVAPDSLTFLYIIFPKNKNLRKFYAFHQWIQHLAIGDRKISWKIGFTFQLLLNITAIILIIINR